MNDRIFIYNDTFISLLNLINYLIENKIHPFNIKNNSYSPTLFDNIINLNLPENDKIITETKNKFGKEAFKSSYLVYLSENENKELIIFYFLLNCLKYQGKIIYMRNLKCVRETLKIASYVSHESHKYKGFVRFKELENKVLYAEIEPVNNILFLISNHFQKRLKNEYWIIKDRKRKIYSIHDKKKVYIVSEDEFTIADSLISYSEQQIVDLWKTFYQTIGIKERKNERCRMNFMPKRYWKYITEMESEL